MFEAYSVGVKIELLGAGAISAALLGMARDFGRAHGAAAALQTRLNGIKTAFLASGLMIGAGVGILAMFKPALDQAKQFQQLQTQFATQYGLGDAATEQAAKFARAMNVMGTSSVDAMRLINESQGVFRSPTLEGAKIAAPLLAKLAFIEAGLGEEERATRHAQDLAMLRFVEARGGANDPRTFSSIADWGFRLSKSSGGIVDWSQLQQLVATAGPMSRTLTQDALSALEPVIADLKGGRVGSGLRVAFQRLLGTQRGLQRQAVAEYLKLGLWDPKKIVLTKQGGIKEFLGAPGDVFRGRLQFMGDPTVFFNKTFLPALARVYGPSILGNTPDAIAKRSVEESLVFGPGTASTEFSQIDKLMPAIQRSLAAQQRTQGIDATYAATGRTLAGKEVALHARFNSLLEQTGEIVLPIAVRALEQLQGPLNWVSTWAQRHPRVFGGIIDGVMGLGAALVVSGVISGLSGLAKTVMFIGEIAPSVASLAASLPAAGAIVNVGIGIAEAIAGVGAAILAIPAGTLIAIAAGLISAGVAIYFMWKNWDSRKSVFDNLKTEIGGFLDWANAQSKTPIGRIATDAVAAAPGGAPLAILIRYWSQIKEAATNFWAGFSKAFTDGWAANFKAIQAFFAPWWDQIKKTFDAGKKALAPFLSWLAGFIVAIENLIPKWMRGDGPKAPPAIAAVPKANQPVSAATAWKAAGTYLGGVLSFNPKATDNFIATIFPAQVAKLNQSNADLTVSHGKLAKSETEAAKILDAAVEKIKTELANFKLNIGNVAVYFDGDKVSRIVSNHQAQGSTGPNSLSHGFDHSAALAGASAGYRR